LNLRRKAEAHAVAMLASERDGLPIEPSDNGGGGPGFHVTRHQPPERKGGGGMATAPSKPRSRPLRPICSGALLADAWGEDRDAGVLGRLAGVPGPGRTRRLEARDLPVVAALRSGRDTVVEGVDVLDAVPDGRVVVVVDTRLVAGGEQVQDVVRAR